MVETIGESDVNGVKIPVGIGQPEFVNFRVIRSVDREPVVGYVRAEQHPFMRE